MRNASTVSSESTPTLARCSFGDMTTLSVVTLSYEVACVRESVCECVCVNTNAAFQVGLFDSFTYIRKQYCVCVCVCVNTNAALQVGLLDIFTHICKQYCVKITTCKPKYRSVCSSYGFNTVTTLQSYSFPFLISTLP